MLFSRTPAWLGLGLLPLLVLSLSAQSTRDFRSGVDPLDPTRSSSKPLGLQAIHLQGFGEQFRPDGTYVPNPYGISPEQAAQMASRPPPTSTSLSQGTPPAQAKAPMPSPRGERLSSALQVLAQRFPEAIPDGFAFDSEASKFQYKEVHLPPRSELGTCLRSLSLQVGISIRIEEGVLLATSEPVPGIDSDPSPPSSQDLERLSRLRSDLVTSARGEPLISVLKYLNQGTGLALAPDLRYATKRISADFRGLNFFQCLEVLRWLDVGEFWIEGKILRQRGSLGPKAPNFRWSELPQAEPDQTFPRKSKVLPQRLFELAAATELPKGWVALVHPYYPTRRLGSKGMPDVLRPGPTIPTEHPDDPLWVQVHPPFVLFGPKDWFPSKQEPPTRSTQGPWKGLYQAIYPTTKEHPSKAPEPTGWLR